MEMKEKELLESTLEDLFIHALPKMESEQPKKAYSEAERIFHFGFESFRMGFLYGLKSGFGTLAEEK